MAAIAPGTEVAHVQDGLRWRGRGAVFRRHRMAAGAQQSRQKKRRGQTAGSDFELHDCGVNQGTKKFQPVFTSAAGAASAVETTVAAAMLLAKSIPWHRHLAGAGEFLDAKAVHQLQKFSHFAFV